MPKLNKIEIDNFRIFPAGEYSEISIADISIITGANSSGKSSLFKALLLLQDNWQKNHLTRLDFTDRNHKLGSIKSVLNDASKPLKIKLSFDDDIALEYEFGSENGELQNFNFLENDKNIFKIERSEKGNYKVIQLDIVWFEFEIKDRVKKLKDENLIWDTEITSYINRIEEEGIQELETRLEAKESNAGEEQEIEDKKQKEIERIEEETELSEEEKQEIQDIIKNKKSIINDLEEKLLKIKEEIDSIEDDEDLRKELEDDEQDLQNQILDLEQELESIENDKLQEKIDALTEEVENEAEYEISNLEKIKSEILNLLRNDKRDELSPFIFQRLNRLLDNYHKRITHLPAFRAEQRRIFALSELEENYQEAIRRFWEIDNKGKEFIIDWFEKFEINYDFLEIKDAEDSGDTFRVWLTGELDEKREIKTDKECKPINRNLADMGFGISQLMPIILVCATAKEGEIISIEEPETNLHPKFQSTLAEMFVKVSEREVQVMLETHSEYLIRKMQEIVAEENNDFSDKQALIYYFTSPEFRKIEFEKDGTIAHEKFGKGFYDETYNREYGLLNIKRKRFFGILTKLKEGFKQEKEEDIDVQLKKIEKEVDSFLEKLDFENYRKKVRENLPNCTSSNLDNLTYDYLTTAEFLFDTNHEEGDFSPVIAQFGRAAENELIKLLKDFTQDGSNNYENISFNFINLNTCKILNESLRVSGKFAGNFNGNRGKTGFCNAYKSYCNRVKFNSFGNFKNAINSSINNHFTGVIEAEEYEDGNKKYPNKTILDHIQGIRNLSAHARQTFSKTDAEAYKEIVIKFFKLWCNHLK